MLPWPAGQLAVHDSGHRSRRQVLKFSQFKQQKHEVENVCLCYRLVASDVLSTH